MGTAAPNPAVQQPRERKSLYDRDFYSWSMQQAEALKRRDFNAVDWENVIEEIQDLGVAQKNSYEAYCARAVEHFLKIQYWKHSTRWVLEHWAEEIGNFRDEMADLIDKNPGLKGKYAEMFADAWKKGRRYAVKSLAKYDVQRIRRHQGASKSTGEELAQPQEHPGYMRQEMRRKWDGILPQECPYRFAHVTAFDAKSDRRPREDVWPPAVAKILNNRLEQNYPVLPDYKTERGPSRGSQPSRGFTWDR